jgi:hypothetical protein
MRGIMNIVYRYTSILILAVLVLFISCEETNTPPEVTITFPPNGSTVSELVQVTCVSTDDESVEKVELWIDGVSTDTIDSSEPYSLGWNTTNYLNGSSHTLTVRSYDNSENKTDSNPVTLTVDNSNSNPLPVNITSITYTLTELMINWNKSIDTDFDHYSLQVSESEEGERTTLLEVSGINDTLQVLSDFNPSIPKWYWVKVSDSYGYSTIGDGYYLVDEPPAEVEITYLSLENNILVINWIAAIDEDFSSYEILISVDSNFTSVDTLATIYSKGETSYTQNFELEVDQRRYFRVRVKDFWELSTDGQFMVLSTYKKIAYSLHIGNNEDPTMLVDIDGGYEEILSDQGMSRLKWDYTGEIIFGKYNDSLISIDIKTKEVRSYIRYGNLDFAISSASSAIVFHSEIDGYLHLFDYELETDRQLLAHSGWRNFAISPNERYVAFVGHELYVLDIETSTLDTVYDVNGRDTKPSWNFSSNKVSYHSGDGMFIYSLTTNENIYYSGTFMNPSFYDENDNLCVYNYQEEKYHFFDASFNHLGTSSLDTGGYNNFSFNGDRSQIAVLVKGDNHSSLALFAINTQTLDYHQITEYKDIGSFSWQP